LILCKQQDHKIRVRIMVSNSWFERKVISKFLIPEERDSSDKSLNSLD